MSITYNLEFEVIPREFERNGSQIFLNLIKNKKYFYELFKKYYKMFGKSVKLKKRDFGMYDFDLGDGYRIMYVSVGQPPAYDFPNVYCVAYCIPYEICNSSIEFSGLYNIELSRFGTNCIGQNIDGSHYNLGPIGQSLKETIANVGEIAFGKKFKIN